jgi:hypothetical protein
LLSCVKVCPRARRLILVAPTVERRLAIFVRDSDQSKTFDDSGKSLSESVGSEAVLKRLNAVDEENGDIKTEARKQFRIVLNIYFLENKEFITAGARNFALHHLT